MRLARAAIAAVFAALAACGVSAQELEPRAYTNLPVGLNFLVIGYAQSQGGLSTDPSLPLENAHLTVNTAVIAYARSLDLWGRSGKFDLILPYAQLDGSAQLQGQALERTVSGYGDPRFRIAINFYGAPALSATEFAAYRQDLVAGASFQVTAPGGQYDPGRAVNIATNRWSFKPDIGLSKTFGPLMLDVGAGVTFYTRNDDFYGGQSVQQDPVYSLQSNLSYNFDGGIWAALGATYYSGGRRTVDGVRKDDALNNSRVGLTLGVPVDRRHSVKFNASSGISTRTGTNFETVGVAWQYRWGS